MSADLLRRAAAVMRAEHEDCSCGYSDCDTSDSEFYDAVALWLDSVADHYDRDLCGFQSEALGVARAYMGSL